MQFFHSDFGILFLIHTGHSESPHQSLFLKSLVSAANLAGVSDEICSSHGTERKLQDSAVTQ
jgi:hypothetical protein